MKLFYISYSTSVVLFPLNHLPAVRNSECVKMLNVWLSLVALLMITFSIYMVACTFDISELPRFFRIATIPVILLISALKGFLEDPKRPVGSMCWLCRSTSASKVDLPYSS